MHTETKAQNIEGGVFTYYNYLGKATLKFGKLLSKRTISWFKEHLYLSIQFFTLRTEIKNYILFTEDAGKFMYVYT